MKMIIEGRHRPKSEAFAKTNLDLDVRVRTLTSSDEEQVKVLDMLSGNTVCDMLDEDGGYAWGIFRNGRLLGYCTIGGVEGTEYQKIVDEADEISVSKTTAKTVSNAYIHPYCRRFGFGSQMIKEAMNDEMYNNINAFFCTIHNYNLYEFYSKLGFHELEDGILLIERSVM